GVLFRYTSSALIAQLNDTAGGSRSLSLARPTRDVWHHIAVTYDPANGGHTRIYIDGVIAGTGNYGVFTPSTSGTFTIGGAPGYSAFRGVVDEVSVYSRPLSAAEVISVFEAGATCKCPV